MTPRVLPRAAVGDLGELLGQGGQARVFRAPGLHLPDAPGPLVFKQYRPGQSPPVSLVSIVAHRAGLDDRARATLDEVACWPLRVVTHDDAVCGVVLRLIPDAYFRERRLPGSGTLQRGLCEVQNLFVAPSLAARLGMPTPRPTERLALCRSFARALHFLHRRGLVVGDVNAKNAVFRLEPAPTVMLVDCDAVRVKGSVAVVRQLNAPDWSPPEGAVLNQATDRYKFGLFVLRCLAPGPMASVSRDHERAADILGAEGTGLLRRALGVDPVQRPTIQDWGRYLDRRLTGRPPAATAPNGGNERSGGRRRRDPTTGAWIVVS